MKERDVIDAEFEVVRQPLEPQRQWNGVGLPPQWREWGWFARSVFVIVYGVIMWWGLMFAIWLGATVPPLLHW